MVKLITNKNILQLGNMEWEDLARKQKGKMSESYCTSNSTLKSVVEYCSEKIDVSTSVNAF